MTKELIRLLLINLHESQETTYLKSYKVDTATKHTEYFFLLQIVENGTNIFMQNSIIDGAVIGSVMLASIRGRLLFKAGFYLNRYGMFKQFFI